MKLTDEEFNIVREHLERMSLNDGDIGYIFWPKVLKYFEELRELEKSSLDS